MPNHPIQFGEWLRTTRDMNRFSLADLANRVGVSKQYLSLLENPGSVKEGRRPSTPSREVVKNIATAFGVPVEEALTLAGYDSEVDHHQILDGVILMFQGHANLSEAQKAKIIETAHLIALGIRSEQLSEWLANAPPTLPLSRP